MPLTTFGQGAIAAATQAMRLAMVATGRTPMPAVAESGKMGAIYDIWAAGVVRASQDAGAAVGALEGHMPNADMKASYAAARKTFGYLQQSLENVLQYSNNRSIVWNTRDEDQAWFKPHARRVHRAAAMELLLVHMARLEFALLLAHTADAQANTNLLGGEFEVQYRVVMQQLGEFLRGDPLLVPAVEIKNQLEAANWLMDVMEWRDVTIGDLIRYRRVCASQASVAARHMVTGVIGQLRLAAAGGLAVPDQGEEVNALPNVAGGFWAAARGVVGWVGAAGAVVAAPAIPGGRAFWQDNTRDEFDRLWNWCLVGEPDNGWDSMNLHWREIKRDFATSSVSSAATVAGIPGLAAHFVGAGANEADQNTVDRALTTMEPRTQLRMRASVHMARQRALAGLLWITDSYDAGANNEVLKRSEEAFFQLMGLFDASETDSVGFRPEWSGQDEKDRLNRLFKREREYATLQYKSHNAVNNQYVVRRANRNVNVEQRTVMHEWWRDVQPDQIDFEHRVMWGLMHCEVNVLADMLHTLGAVVEANRQSREDGMAPTRLIHLLAIRSLERIEPLLGEDGGVLQLLENTHHSVFGVPALGVGGGAVVPDKAHFDALLRTLRTDLKQPPADVCHTTQPMSRVQRQYLQAVYNAFKRVNNNQDYSAAGSLLDPRTKFSDLWHNWLTHRSYRALPVGNPEIPRDSLESGNVVWRRPMPTIAWALAKLLPIDSPARRSVIRSLVSAYTVNSQFVVHFGAAVREMLKLYSVLPEQYVLGGNANNRLAIQINAAAAAYPYLAQNVGYGTRVSPSVHMLFGLLANRPAIALEIQYPTLRQISEQSLRNEEALKKRAEERKPPVTYPAHWLDNPNPPTIANGRWNMLDDVPPNDPNAVIINFQNIAIIPPVAPNADDNILLNMTRQHY